MLYLNKVVHNDVCNNAPSKERKKLMPNAVVVQPRFTPAPVRSDEKLDVTKTIINLVSNEDGIFTSESTMVPSRNHRFPRVKLRLDEVLTRIGRIRKSMDEQKQHAFITAVIPAWDEESTIGSTIESLLIQTRQVDQIVVMVNNSTDNTADIARRYAKEFPGQIVVEVDDDMAYGKVGALGYSWEKYVADGQSDFALFVDADVECDSNMLARLEQELIDEPNAAGIRSRYSFAVPNGAKFSERFLVYEQRHEFAQVEIRDYIRGRRTHILGGQATLFRADVLDKVASLTTGNIPWDRASAVEDSKLSTEIRKMGYKTLVSKTANASVGAMTTSYSLRKQRIKWTNGHIKDAVSNGELTRPGAHAHVWRQQVSLAWNLLIRLLFFTMLAVSLTMHMFVFNPLWLLPSALSVVYNVLVARKIPNRSSTEVIRSLLYFPDELALWRTLSVWLTSWCMMIPFIASARSTWDDQRKAENSKKTGTLVAWLILVLLVAIPFAGLMALSGFLSVDTMSSIVSFGWTIAQVMTVISAVVLGISIFRLLGKYKSISL